MGLKSYKSLLERYDGEDNFIQSHLLKIQGNQPVWEDKPSNQCALFKWLGKLVRWFQGDYRHSVTLPYLVKMGRTLGNEYAQEKVPGRKEALFPYLKKMDHLLAHFETDVINKHNLQNRIQIEKGECLSIRKALRSLINPPSEPPKIKVEKKEAPVIYPLFMGTRYSFVDKTLISEEIGIPEEIIRKIFLKLEGKDLAHLHSVSSNFNNYLNAYYPRWSQLLPHKEKLTTLQPTAFVHRIPVDIEGAISLNSSGDIIRIDVEGKERSLLRREKNPLNLKHIVQLNPTHFAGYGRQEIVVYDINQNKIVWEVDEPNLDYHIQATYLARLSDTTFLCIRQLNRAGYSYVTVHNYSKHTTIYGFSNTPHYVDKTDITNFVLYKVVNEELIRISSYEKGTDFEYSEDNRQLCHNGNFIAFRDNRFKELKIYSIRTGLKINALNQKDLVLLNDEKLRNAMISLFLSDRSRATFLGDASPILVMPVMDIKNWIFLIYDYRDNSKKLSKSCIEIDNGTPCYVDKIYSEQSRYCFLKTVGYVKPFHISLYVWDYKEDKISLLRQEFFKEAIDDFKLIKLKDGLYALLSCQKFSFLQLEGESWSEVPYDDIKVKSIAFNHSELFIQHVGIKRNRIIKIT